MVMTSTVNTPMWQRYIESKIGFVLPKTQVRWLNNAITTTAEDSQLSVPELWLAIQADVRLRQQLLDRTLIAESRFFRHVPSLNYVVMLAKAFSQTTLAEHYVQEQKAKNSRNPSLKIPKQKSTHFRIWSVGCAKGQEVWSLAMLLENSGIVDYRILGTDVNYEAIQEARLGRYSAREIAAVPSDYSHYISHYIQDYESDPTLVYHSSKTKAVESGNCWQVCDSLGKKVTFRHHNMFTSKVATKAKQQVIICQNMLIYFRQFDQRDILARLVEHCEVGGHIILAPGEALFWRHPKMQRVSHPQVNLWQKVEA